MRRFVNGDRFWEIEQDGLFVVTRHGVAGKPPKVDRRYCKEGAAAYLADRVHRRKAEPGWIEDKPTLATAVAAAAKVTKAAPAALRTDADAPVGADLKRLTAAPSPEGEALRASAPVVPELDPRGRALLLSMVPTRNAADLVIARYGVHGLVEALLVGAWWSRDDAAYTPYPRPRAELPNWLVRARELALATDVKEALAAANAASRDTDLWRLADVAFVLGDAAFAASLLPRCSNGVPPGACHFVASLDPAGWNVLLEVPMDGKAARRFQLEVWVPALIARHGAGALAVPWVADNLDALRTLHHPDAARKLLKLLPKGKADPKAKGADPVFAALRAMPAATLTALATDGAETDRQRELAKALAEVPELVATVRPQLDAAPCKRLDGWAGAPPAPEATSIPPLLAGKPSQRLPSWVGLAWLPPLHTADGAAAYPATARARLVEVLIAGGSPTEVREVCETRSLGAFVVGLFEQYVASTEARRAKQQAEYDRQAANREQSDHEREHGIRPWVRRADTTVQDDDRWVWQALTSVGGEHVARALAEAIRNLPPRMWQLQSDAVDVLAGLRDPVVLVELGSLARRGPTAAKRQAALQLQAMGRSLGLDGDRIEEVLLPDLGLGADGTLVLDFGPRQFTVGFDGALDPVVRDSEGLASGTLPRPKKTDDPERAKAATATWKALKKDVRTVTTTLLGRLERALRRSSGWKVAQFQDTLVAHPFARHVVRRLLWTCGPVRFRIDESGRPVDADDADVALSGAVELVHPVRLSDEELARWRAVFFDYAIVQPFQQLDRAVHRADPVADAGPHLARLRDTRFKRGRMFALKQRGWRWVRDGELVTGLAADWISRDILAELEPFSPTEGDEPVVLRDVSWVGRSWATADAMVFSEVVRDLWDAAHEAR